jgi:hypothetical protein
LPKFEQGALPLRRHNHHTPKPIFEAERCAQVIQIIETLIFHIHNQDGQQAERGEVQQASLQVQETEGEKGKRGKVQDTANWLKRSHAEKRESARA